MDFRKTTVLECCVLFEGICLLKRIRMTFGNSLGTKDTWVKHKRIFFLVNFV